MSGASHKPTTPFDACIAIYNPNSTNANQARARIKELEELFPPKACTILETSSKGDAANRRLLIKHAAALGPRTLIAVAGGDGTINFVADTLLNDPSFTPEMRQAPILPLWGGNGNDLAHMLNGTPHRLHMRHLLEATESISFHPLSCEITVDGKHTTRIALCYASFGASAFAAYKLETSRGIRPFFYRIGIARFLHELSMVSRAMMQAPRFLIEDAKHTRTIYDRLFINGSRFAKVGGLPLRLTDDWFYHVTVEQKSISSLAFHITGLVRRNPDRYIVKGHQSVSFTLHEATQAQIDGEVIALSAGTHIRIELSTSRYMH